jgi:hypothetical protein
MKWSVTEKGNVIASCLVYVEEQTIFPCVIFILFYFIFSNAIIHAPTFSLPLSGGF